MVAKEDISFIKQQIFSLLSFDYSGTIEIVDSDSLVIKGNKEYVQIGCSRKCELARGLFLLAKELASGKGTVFIKQKAAFSTCGAMLDFSRGSVYTVSAVKKYMAHMAALGMNMLLLYLEDTYELPGYPRFGHMRGRYTQSELRELDDYADALGIELIPCVQTLAHLRIYLKWEEADDIRDTDEVLLIGEEKTYDFIRTILQTLSKTFRSRRVHIGMDEAHTMGQGVYAKRNAVVDKKKMFIEHLNRVKAMCTEEGLMPIIWSDMIFRVCGGEGGVNEEYDPNSVITPDIAEAISGLNLSYWDYYRTEQSEYDGIIRRHQQFNADISFAGGIWTWDGYLPNFRYTFDTMLPALRACLERNITEVYATCWGCNGMDTDHMHAIPGLAIFSEFCYQGKDCTQQDILDVAEFLTGANEHILFAVSDFFMHQDGAVGIGQRLVDSDVLYEQLRYPIDYIQTAKVLRRGLEELKKYPANELAKHAALLLEIAAEKCEVFQMLRPAYQAGDMLTLRMLVDEKLPVLIQLCDEFFANYEAIMERNRKPFGTEVIHIRFAGIGKRLQYAQRKLCDYVEGKLSSIPELEEKALNDEHATWLASEAYMKTM